MGDSANPSFPSFPISVEGVFQAIQDEVTFATILKLAGSTKQAPTVPLVYEDIRWCIRIRSIFTKFIS
jgi:hypothetical protein